jgi:hypothetical protein
MFSQILNSENLYYLRLVLGFFVILMSQFMPQIMLINRVKIYTTIQSQEVPQKPILNSDSISYENLGNKFSSICCILNCTSPLSESKDYKTLTKVFKKLMMNIENVYVININNSKSNNFIHFIHEFNFSKIFIFGEDALMNNLPVSSRKAKIYLHMKCSIYC